MPDPAPSSDSLALLARLIAFDTTSRRSNLELIEWVRGYLADLGVESRLVHSEDGAKANLYATLGPVDRGGIVLSGHTDVVPTEGQDWDTDPYAATRADGRIYGRGSADMKGFLAVCLALAPEMLEAGLATPLHFALSYDEEVGCIGVRRLLGEMATWEVRPTGCVIGEPTGMRVIRAHKGKHSVRAHVRGLSCHSGLAHRGVNAVEAAAEVIARLKAMARDFRDQGPYDEEFDPPYTTVHTGTCHGGTALNIVPDQCVFEFEFRHLPVQDPEALLGEVQEFARERVLPEMRQVCGEAGIEWERLTTFPGLDTPEDAGIVRLAKTLAQSNESGKVSFGTEGGLFDRAGIPAVVCGPGSIEQAHKPNEFVDLAQIARCEAFVRRLIEHLRAA